MSDDFELRSNTAVSCLPDAPYKDMLRRLHTEMLEAIEQLKHEKSGLYQELINRRYDLAGMQKTLNKAAEMLGFDFGGDISFEITPESFLEQVEKYRDSKDREVVE